MGPRRSSLDVATVDSDAESDNILRLVFHHVKIRLSARGSTSVRRIVQSHDLCTANPSMNVILDLAT
jgi:hypothetical protein